MEDKSTDSYDSLLRLLCEIYSARHPESNGLKPSRVNLDFEKASYKSFRAMFPQTPIKMCGFHMVKSIRKKICEKFGTSNPSKHTVTNQLMRLCRGLPYLEWSEPLKTVLFAELKRIADDHYKETERALRKEKDKSMKKGRHEDYKTAEKYVQSVDKFIKYLDSNFLSSSKAQGYKSWSKIDENNLEDYTNNSNEGCNAAFNATFVKGKKSYAGVCQLMYEFVASHAGQEIENVRHTLN